MITVYHIAPKRSGHAFIGNMIKSWAGNAEYTYHDKENTRPNRFIRTSIKQSCIIILQTRDLLNWYASYWTSTKRPNGRIINTWFDITREFYRPKHLKEFKVINVMYDKFFSEKTYRLLVHHELIGKVGYNEDMLNTITEHGWGSSFSGREYDGRAQEMNVLERYREVPQDIYRRLFSVRPDILRFYRKYMAGEKHLQFIKSL